MEANDPSKFRNDRDGGFIILANDIGALGDPQNSGGGGGAGAHGRTGGGEGGGGGQVRGGEVQQLKRSLERDGHKVVGDFLLARYKPPWTLRPLRTNEVMLPVE